MTKNYRGIDYGMGRTNIDRETGVRYGVINMNALSEWAWESFEADYGDPACPKCGGEVVDSSDLDEDAENERERADQGDGRLPLDIQKDYFCRSCNKSYWSDRVYGDDPNGWTLDDGEYQATVDSQNDVFITRSPYYTHAQFCSPCAPGAGHLENPTEDGVKTYAFGHDWFDGDVAPYPVYSVATGRRVAPERKKVRRQRRPKTVAQLRALADRANSACQTLLCKAKVGTCSGTYRAAWKYSQKVNRRLARALGAR